MTQAELDRLRTILQENLQSFCLVGFALDGEKITASCFETEIQSYALVEAVRQELNRHASAPEVWVRNIDEWEDL